MLSDVAKTHCDAVKQHLLKHIREKNYLSFEQFMQLALYAPGLGYYSAGAEKFGPAGDYITAPELGPLFATTLAHQCYEVLSEVKGGEILELGAGTGKMAADILKTLARQDCFPNYYILERSADLRARQALYFKEQIPSFVSQIQWLDRLPMKPIRGVIVANEVIDAMAVHKFKLIPDKKDGVIIQEYVVTEKNNEFQWQLAQPSSAHLNNAVNDLVQRFHLPTYYESEINLQLKPWLAALSDVLKEGVLLFIDYGFPAYEYYHPDRGMGTLMCHYRHRSHPDPFLYPGLQDITAHVDFTAVANAAIDNHFDIAGFTSQATFLINCGLLNLLPDLDKIRDYYSATQEIKRLTLPHEMGELFKVLALTRQYGKPLMGFFQNNQVERLSCLV